MLKLINHKEKFVGISKKDIITMLNKFDNNALNFKNYQSKELNFTKHRNFI